MFFDDLKEPVYKKAEKKILIANGTSFFLATPQKRWLVKTSFTVIVRIIQDSATYYPMTLEALLFRLLTDKKRLFIQGEKEALEISSLIRKKAIAHIRINQVVSKW
jgi:hypothetical protein